MDLRAFDRVAYQLVYFELMILGCTVHCRFRFSDCTVIHCDKVDKKYTGCNLKTMQLLDCALIGLCAVIRSNTAVRGIIMKCEVP